jgi:DNA invertase Pin-like site-specific DNA recombinase
LRDARRRRLDVVLCWRLDRLGRRLGHLISVLTEFESLGVGFVTLGEGFDTTTPAGRFHMHLLGALAEFERGRLGERVRAGLARVRARGTRLGRPRQIVPVDRITSVAELTVDEAAATLGVSRSTIKRWRREVQKTPVQAGPLSPVFSPKSRDAVP